MGKSSCASGLCVLVCVCGGSLVATVVWIGGSNVNTDPAGQSLQLVALVTTP